MATQAPQPTNVSLETPITIKVFYQGSVKKFQVPLKDLGINGFDQKLRSLLEVPEGTSVTFERFSDSAGSYVRLERGNPQVYKTLLRAAKAKLKLRLKATTNEPYTPSAEPSIAQSTVSSKAASSSAETLVPATKESDTMNSVLNAAAAKAVPQHTTPMCEPRGLEIRTKDSLPTYTNWSVYCNACDIPMANEHYHCTKCDGGDFDLCQTCVNAGNHCHNEDHWLIKRFVKNGQVINSNTEKFLAKSKARSDVKHEPTPNASSRPASAASKIRKVVEPTRTCNSCVKVYAEKEFVTCQDCDDYDLCMACHVDAKHGHHPGHTFAPATKETKISALAEYLCTPGRNVRHAAVCDGCDRFIYGVRHKCLKCPDWDYCSACHKNAKFIHANHRFVPIYDPLPETRARAHRHGGIFCDGPLCKDKRQRQNIEGVRYKCAICNDTDFCANCEASPANRHNRTHPLIMFKTPVRSVSIATNGEDKNGSALPNMGDQTTHRSASTKTTPATPSNAPTQVQTVADLKPIEPRLMTVPTVASSPAAQDTKQHPPLSFVVNNNTDLAAHFVRDSIQDGTKMAPGTLFEQTWVMRNPGPATWLPGCSVRYVGGDNMLNVGDNQISTAAEISEATESNVFHLPVVPGQTAFFRVKMKAPQREGVAISYWRLKAADGTPFGHRLWCHIEVAAPLPSVLPPLPSNVRAASTGDRHGMQDYQMQLMLLEQQNRRRLALNRQQQMADADALTRQHTLMRQQTLQQMRTTAAFIDSEYQRLLSPTVKAEPSAEKMPELAATPAAPGAPAPPSPPTYMPRAAQYAFPPAAGAAAAAIAVAASASTEPEVSGSRMIFPSLEKESPVSSTHEALVAPESPTAVEHAETETVMSPSVKSELEFFEDAETVNFSDEESFDDLATDDEYDILDASDQEA